MTCPVSRQTPKEELYNRLTHGLALAVSLVGLGCLLTLSWDNGWGARFVAAIYGGSLVQLFAASTFYHSTVELSLKRKARILDHCSIFVLIAGSYTPFMLLALGGWKGWALLLLVWVLTGFGIYHKCTSENPFGVRSVLFYLLLGWLVMVVYNPLVAALGPSAKFWLVSGGMAYTAGTPIYAWKSLSYSHCLWHLFVMAGAVCHFLAVASLF